MEASIRDLMARMPLAEAVLTLWHWVADADLLAPIFAQNRGRCYETILWFSLPVDLIRDALLEFNGSGRRTLEKAQERGQLETSFRAVSGTRQRLPIAVSTALLGGCTARPAFSLPRPIRRGPAAGEPRPLQDRILDGPASKRVAKRLKPLWGLPGGVLGGRALVARDRRSGLATAMSAHPDGGMSGK